VAIFNAVLTSIALPSIMESRTSNPDKDNTADKTPNARNDGIPGSPAKGEEKKGFASKMKGIWSSLDLDVPTVFTMMKGGLPPAISMAMYVGL